MKGQSSRGLPVQTQGTETSNLTSNLSTPALAPTETGPRAVINHIYFPENTVLGVEWQMREDFGASGTGYGAGMPGAKRNPQSDSSEISIA